MNKRILTPLFGYLSSGVAGLIAVLVCAGLLLVPLAGFTQTLTPVRDAWKQVYQRFPALPLENQYVSLETGKINPNSTLVSRLIRYHQFVKGRSPLHRLDWKLTLADYLGVNEVMIAGAYPGQESLRTNPLEGDRSVIQRLDRSQRDRLVQVLANIFNPNVPTVTTPPTPKASPLPSPRPPDVQRIPTTPRPGDAQLLLPK
jgi:hypothetical protein